MSAPVCAIEGVPLEPHHEGARVLYVDPHGGPEVGALSSWRIDTKGLPATFVRFRGPTGERCPPERLRWAKEESE